MPGSVDNINSVVSVDNTSTLRENSDASFLFQIIAIHSTSLIEHNTSLFQEAIHKGGLAVIDVSNNSQVSHLALIIS